MLSDAIYRDMNAVAQAQRHLIRQVETRVQRLEGALSADAQAETASDLAQIAALLDEVEAAAGILPANAMDGWDLQRADIEAAYHRCRASVQAEIQAFAFRDWDQFVVDSVRYCADNGLDPTLPWSSLLTDEDLAKLQSEADAYDSQFRWDKWDYVVVGVAGVLAALTDYLLVRIPTKLSSSGEILETMTYDGKEYAGSPITAFLQKHVNSTDDKEGWFADWARGLEDTCKTSYDAVNDTGLEGMFPRSHRLQSLGHDPVLGLVFGVLDIMRGTITGFSYDKLTGSHTLVCNPMGEPTATNLIEAILKHLGHLVSDVGTAQGLPAPLFGLFQGINVVVPGSPKGRTVGEIARWMYLNGYDLRHFIASGVTPATIEIIVRGFLMLRHYSEHGEIKFKLADHPKYRAMLLAAHSIACAGNAGKVYLMGGNPLAINYAEWLAMTRYLLPSVKYWLFDKKRLRLEHFDKVNDEGWDNLLAAGDRLLVKSYADLPMMRLGGGA